MYVHHSNNVLNILRVAETHMLSRYGQEWSEAARALSNDHAAGHDLVQSYTTVSDDEFIVVYSLLKSTSQCTCMPCWPGCLHRFPVTLAYNTHSVE
jgi:hypothetical protein